MVPCLRHPQLIDGLGGLLPKFLKGRILRVLSKTSFLIKSDVTDKILNRYISDLHPCETSSRFVALENAEEGLKAFMSDAGGLESIKEMEEEEIQLKALTGNEEALEAGERDNRMDFGHTNPEFNQTDDQDQAAGDGQERKAGNQASNKQAVPERQSRRLKQQSPEYSPLGF